MVKPYKDPTIVRSKNGDWFIKFFYEKPDQPGVFQEFRVRDGINYIHDPEEKEKAVQALRKDVAFWLEYENYNPFGNIKHVKKKIKAKKDELATPARQPWTLDKAMTEFLNYCRWKKLSEKTIKGYTTYINNFREYLTESGQLNELTSEYYEGDVVKFCDVMDDQEEWAPRTYNNHIDFMKTLFTRCEKLERKEDREINKNEPGYAPLQYRIDMTDVEQKTDKAEKNRAYSGIVAERVKRELAKEENKQVNRLIQFIYYSCMRPKEIRLLQIQHIDIPNRQIKVTAPTGKTGDRFVPISDELLELIRGFNINKYPLNYYLFGKYDEPAEVPFAKDRYSKMYYPIKIKLNLDKNYTMYGWKHTRVIDLSTAGFSDEEIMQLTGHTDYQAFKLYKRDLVVDTKVMTGKTKDF